MKTKCEVCKKRNAKRWFDLMPVCEKCYLYLMENKHQRHKIERRRLNVEKKE
jgi:hypothetical protein